MATSGINNNTRLIDWAQTNGVELKSATPIQIKMASSAIGISADEVLNSILALQTSGFDHRAVDARPANTEPVIPQPDVFTTEVPLPDAVLGLSSVADHFSARGYGDQTYWSRTHADLVGPTHALGRVLKSLASHLSDDSVQVEFSNVASRLATLPDEGYGDSKYWSSRVTSLVNDSQDSMAKLVKLSGLGSSTAVSPKEMLLAFATIADSVCTGSYGDVDYWIKNAIDIDNVCEGLGKGLTLTATHLPSPKRDLVEGIADEFKALSSKGYGDAKYWSSRTSTLENECKALAKRLEVVAATL